MADSPDEIPTEPAVELGPWERWSTDWNGTPIIVFDDEAHAAWCAKWCPPCPDGNHQRLIRALGFRERNRCELELRVPLALGRFHVCQVVLDERADEVHVRVLACYREDDDDSRLGREELTDCPVRVWLEHPLGDRAVIDVDSDEELDEFSWVSTSPDLVGRFQPSNRRTPTSDRSQPEEE